MNKGYIIPSVLVVLLLILSGFFLFTPVQTPRNPDVIVSPKATSSIPVIQDTPINSDDTIATTTNEEIEEDEGFPDTATSSEIF
jgi:hypothetical protein